MLRNEVIILDKTSQRNRLQQRCMITFFFFKMNQQIVMYIFMNCETNCYLPNNFCAVSWIFSGITDDISKVYRMKVIRV